MASKFTPGAILIWVFIARWSFESYIQGAVNFNGALLFSIYGSLFTSKASVASIIIIIKISQSYIPRYYNNYYSYYNLLLSWGILSQ